MLDVVMKSSWVVDKAAMGKGVKIADRWLIEKLREVGAKLPRKQEAMRFSVERIWRERPWGYAGVRRWHGDKREMVDRWCPEWRLAVEALPER